MLGGVTSKGCKVNALFPFFGHIHHAGFVQIVVAQIAHRLYFGDMHEKVRVVGVVDDLPDVLKARFPLRCGVQRVKVCGGKGFQTRRKEIQLVNPGGAHHIIGQRKTFPVRAGIPVDKKVLRVIGSNADALHSRVKLLRCRWHGKPRAAQFSRCGAAAAVNQDRKNFAQSFAPFCYQVR